MTLTGSTFALVMLSGHRLYRFFSFTGWKGETGRPTVISSTTFDQDNVLGDGCRPFLIRLQDSNPAGKKKFFGELGHGSRTGHLDTTNDVFSVHARQPTICGHKHLSDNPQHADPLT